ncbi:hypothetical protein ACFQ60_37555 [Streptomyces zhihengii]
MQRLPAKGAMAAVEAAEDEVAPCWTARRSRSPPSTAPAPRSSPATRTPSRPSPRTGGPRAPHPPALRQPRLPLGAHGPDARRLRRRGRAPRLPAPVTPVVSGLTGRPAEGIDTPGHWVRQVREPVRFHDGLRTLRDLGCATYLELGPDAVLASLAREALTGLPDAAFTAALRRGRPETATAAAALATAHAQGRALDWAAVIPGGRRTDLPTRVFLRRRHWPFPPSPETESGRRDAVPGTAERAPQPSLRCPPRRRRGARHDGTAARRAG